ncbi:hypothetical protein [Roseovarius phycicola]|uniref:Pilus assembly protein n=1 Tax=Roseovarius phycicola TaxID=3080976 RepID=A0ABZ2HGN7_9RHOB
MRNFFKSFRDREDGAVTVDWVVLTAAIIAVAIGAIDTVGAATNSVADNVATGMTSIQVGTGGGSGG